MRGQGTAATQSGRKEDKRAETDGRRSRRHRRSRRDRAGTTAERTKHTSRRERGEEERRRDRTETEKKAQKGLFAKKKRRGGGRGGDNECGGRGGEGKTQRSCREPRARRVDANARGNTGGWLRTARRGKGRCVGETQVRSREEGRRGRKVKGDRLTERTRRRVRPLSTMHRWGERERREREGTARGAIPAASAYFFAATGGLLVPSLDWALLAAAGGEPPGAAAAADKVAELFCGRRA